MSPEEQACLDELQARVAQLELHVDELVQQLLTRQQEGDPVAGLRAFREQQRGRVLQLDTEDE